MRLDNAAEARSHIVVAIGEMLRHRGGAFWSRADWRIVVTDEAGVAVCAIAVMGQAGDEGGRLSSAAKPCVAPERRTVAAVS